VIARGAGAAVFLLGLYIVLRISGLTRLALTVIGGTGLLGLVLGIAFRDIAENFLASILLSVQAPFRQGDLIEVAGVLGIVRQLNVRTTVLMSLSGHHIQLPNALVYKSTIRNYSANPNRREDFTVGIGYDVPINRAQELALKVLDEHPAVLKSPEPWVLAENLGSATVTLRVYFWLDGSRYSWLKVRSSVVRLVKRSFQDHEITMPDEVREVIFPQGVPIQVAHDAAPVAPPDGRASPLRSDSRKASPAESSDEEEVAVEAEGGLHAESKQIQEQADRARSPEEGENLLPTH
jgi:small-conductance mechanosensitive channel